MRYRKEAILLLKESLNHLWTVGDIGNRVPNVCYAITRAFQTLSWCAETQEQYQRRFDAHAYLEERIKECLGSHRYVSDWLSNRLDIYIYDAASSRNWSRPPNLKLIRYRRAWVKDMIRTLENGGDL